jgi:broad specificity phosphatase PhoE
MASHTSRAPTLLLLCRHGQSEWNVQRRIQGQSLDAGGLTAQGRWEAQQLGRRLQALDIVALYASDLLRSQETAQIVSAALDLPVQFDPRWREIDLGVWQGMTPEEVDQRWPGEEIRALDLPRGEIGETFAALSQRTLAAMVDLAHQHPGETVAAVCHGGNVRAALMATDALAVDGPDPRRAPIPNTSVTVLQVNDAGLQAMLIADVSHLDGAALEIGDANADE